MIVNSQNIELGYELISVLPYANYLNSLGILEKTISGNDTECLYFFSPKHEINPYPRSFFYNSKCTTPNIRIHVPELDKRNFLPPDLKSYWSERIPDKLRKRFKKELVIICNRHNIEWNHRPINYFDLDTLRKMFILLQDKYQVVYINVEGRPELYDNCPPQPFGDFDLLKEFPKVINFHDLCKEFKFSFNTLQLMTFCMCQKFITMNGGHAILAAYFGGENIIMSKHGEPEAQEIKPHVNSYYRWYYDLGRQRCIHVENENILLDRIKDMWIECNPVVNIMIRTSHRPNYFRKCIESINIQTYKNINIIVSIDDKGNDYTIPYKVYPVFVDKIKIISEVKNNELYGKIFPYNSYFNYMYNRANEGLIINLDDDDKFSNENSISEIVEQYKQGAELILWRVKIDYKLYPDDDNWMKPPKIFQISTIGFAFDTKYKAIAIWEPYKRGDYRIADILWKNINQKGFINKVLTECQDGPHYGQHVDLIVKQKQIDEMEKLVKLKIIRDRNHHGKFDVIVGSIVEQPENVAKGWVKTGIAEYVDEVIVTTKKVIEVPKQVKKADPVLIEKVVNKPKAGRPKRRK